jgi:hypothetical protein
VIARALAKQAADREPMWPECMPGTEGLARGQGAEEPRKEPVGAQA